MIEAPEVSVEGRKTQSIVFIDPGSNMNFITRELAYQLQLEAAWTTVFMKRVDKEYIVKEVKVYRLGVEDEKKQIQWVEAVGVGSITESVPLQNKDEIKQDFPEIREGAVKRPAIAAGLLISMTKRQLHSQGGIEKDKLRLSQTPLGCRQVLTGVASRGERSQEGMEVSAECRALQAATTTRPAWGKSFHVEARRSTQDMTKAREWEDPVDQEERGTYHIRRKGPHDQKKEEKQRPATRREASTRKSPKEPRTKEIITREGCHKVMGAKVRKNPTSRPF